MSLLESGRSFTAGALASELGISRRTFFRDLNMLELAGVPCGYDADERTYRIEQSFFLPSLSLTVEEALLILLAGGRFVSPESMPLSDVAARAADKIRDALPAPVRDYCQAVLDGVRVTLPPLVDASRTGPVFRGLHRALAEHRNVRVEYDSYFEQRTVGTVVSPYRVLFLSRAWYLVGRSSLHDDVRTFKLDRITGMEILADAFEPDPDFDVDAYFGLAWNMIPEGKVYHVRLRFLPMVAGNVEEVTWHRTQRCSVQPDGSCLFEVDVDGLREITWWLLGYGDQVIVEEPPELRDRIGEIARNMCQLAGVGEEGS